LLAGSLPKEHGEANMQIISKEQRLIVVRLGIEFAAASTRAYGVRPESPLDFLIGSAVQLATLEQRPMTAHKLAQFLDLPRSTVLRRLGSLARRQILIRREDGTYVLSSRMIAQRTYQVHRMSKLIIKAADELRSLGHL
jgi:DNA-binding transcriptional ArsR family regulator